MQFSMKSTKSTRYTPVYLWVQKYKKFSLCKSCCVTWRNQRRNKFTPVYKQKFSCLFLFPFPCDSLFMPLEFWKNIMYEEGTIVPYHGTCVPTFFEKKIWPLGVLTEIWPRVEKRKFKWYTPVYHGHTLIYW